MSERNLEKRSTDDMSRAQLIHNGLQRLDVIEDVILDSCIKK